MFDLHFGLFGVSGCMDEIRDPYFDIVRVRIRHMCVIASDGSGSGGFRFGGSYDLADIFDDFHSFKHKSDNRSCTHHLQGDIEYFLSMPCQHFSDIFVMMMQEFLIRTYHLHGYDMKPCPFETGDDFSYDTATYAIGFQYHQSSLYVSHFSQ